MEERPLITFFVVAFNQEAFVREAIAGAFAQTWEPLQIVLSDDASKDGTFAIMEEMAAAYDGPHRVVLNRNPTNLGIGEHVNACMALAEGELIVGSAGDDVSLPHRVQRLYEAWLASGKTAFSMD
ncbi:MAG: glycosyltransferase family 2 protein, partial [Myxococcales bacterium]|nr:glycosyltransferase family 2 protein [Myxococcales bacterium]